MNKKCALLATTLLLGNTFSQAQEADSIAYTITPDDSNMESISYNRSLQIIEKERPIKYGEQIDVLINTKEGTVDIFNLDDIVIRVPLDEILSQPNRVGPDQPK
jgi:hypothetical protein